MKSYKLTHYLRLLQKEMRNDNTHYRKTDIDVNMVVENELISQTTCGVHQGSVLGPHLFIMYTTPLSHLIESSSVDHHLYADDTQLFILQHSCLLISAT